MATTLARPAALSLVGLLTAHSAVATEGGGSIYPIGAESFVCCALPPPGLYGLTYVNHYRANKVRDDAGNVATPPTFQVRATAVVPRLVYVSQRQVAGASLAFSAIFPVVTLDVDVVPGVGQSKTGHGDIVLGTALGWHLSQALHTVAAVDVFLPTGHYSATDIANVGRNYWAVQPIFGVSYIDPAGLNADAKVMWTFNGKNTDTNYRSGQELIVDYSIGKGFGNGFTAGVGGYLYQQVTNDRHRGSAVANNKGRAFSIGPSFKYDSGKGWFATAKYGWETSVRNRPDGAAFWLKAVLPL